jgi:hypothetical protein
MSVPMIPGESSMLTEDDARKRDAVNDLIRSQNKVIVEFAKQLVTLNFSAIGVVLALKEKWLGVSPPLQEKVLLGIAVALFLAAALLSTTAAGAYPHRVSLSDYSEVDEEIQRVARLRYRLTLLGFGASVVATILVAAVVLWD